MSLTRGPPQTEGGGLGCARVRARVYVSWFLLQNEYTHSHSTSKVRTLLALKTSKDCLRVKTLF